MKLAFKFTLILGILGAILFSLEINKKDPEYFNYKIIESNDGYGYTILLENKMLIKQTYIPTISNKQAFCNAKDAEKVAKLVKTKLNYGQNPSVTIKEIKDLDIKTTNCNP